MIYALCRKIDFVENLRVFGVKIWTEISIRVKNLTFSMSGIDCCHSAPCTSWWIQLSEEKIPQKSLIAEWKGVCSENFELGF